RGRQIAFENSKGKYIISNLDLDDVFKPVLSKILKIYHQFLEGYVVAINKPPYWSGITIGPRKLLEELGGWRDLQFSEDWDLWARAAKIGKFKVLPFELRKKVGIKGEGGVIQKLLQRFIKYRENYRLGRRIFIQGENVNFFQRIISYLAYLASFFYSSYRDPFNNKFSAFNKQYVIDITISEEQSLE
ncbi:MAG: hypothetical protein QXN87_06885, partial [Candidatus Bathyarchaeia archaeon]